LIERARRRAVKHIAGLRVEAALVTRALKALALALEINGAGEVRALLPVSVILPVRRAYEDGRVPLGRVAEVKRRARRKRVRAFDLHRRIVRRAPRVERGLAREAGCADEERGRSQREEVAELAPRHMRLLAALVWEVVLMRGDGAPHVALV